MFNWFKSRRHKAPQSSFAPVQSDTIAPKMRFYAVGDVHGCLAQLEQLLERITQQRQHEEPLIFVGDTIDRGPQSAQVLQLIFELAQSAAKTTTLLMGNHEKMLLEFIDDPAGRGARWLVNGGLETLRSFGISDLPKNPDAEDATEAADALERALPDGLQDWLRKLPLQWASGNMHCVHAAMNPDRNPEDQSERSLIWGHPEFLHRARTDGSIVIHGHTIVTKPNFKDGRIAIDTGAHKNRPLSAVRVCLGQIEFLQA